MRNKYFILLVAGLMVALGLISFTSTSATAQTSEIRHTSNFGANCDGIVLHAESYDDSAQNIWSLTKNGVTRTGTFGSSFDRTFTVPQNGKTTDWSAYIEAEDGSYHFEDSGSVGPCGTPPPEFERVKTHVKVVDECNCYRDKVTMIGNKHVTIQKFHPSNRVWRFKVTGKHVGNLQYLLPSEIGGNTGWASAQWYKVKTKDQICPCVRRGDCQQVHPHFTPPPNHCRGRCK